MTAEVAIANASAVALAADSAVTIGDQKIYNSALKLFALSKVAPVGIMIYGSASLLSVPWEILIKSYRNQLGNNIFSSLTEYANDFISYLDAHPNAFPDVEQLNWLDNNVIVYFELIRNEIFDELHPIFKNKGEVDKLTVLDILKRIVSEHHEYLSNENFVDNRGQKDFKNIRKKYLSSFKAAREKIFEKLEMPRNVVVKLYDIAALLHVKQIFSTGVSGVVVAGYGETELYPSIETFDIEGVIENRLKYRKNKDKCHSIGNVG